jgi:hypothetical protein
MLSMTYNECDWLQRKQSESLGNILGNNDELSEAAAQILSFGPAMAHDRIRNGLSVRDTFMHVQQSF